MKHVHALLADKVDNMALCIYHKFVSQHLLIGLALKILESYLWIID